MARVKKLSADPYESARAVGLRYVSPDAPGISRRGKRYFRPEGRELKDPLELARIQSLVIPPAWKRVWICLLANGHLQAIGYDQRGRRQYRYHPAFRQVRDLTKFARMVAFGKALPEIRRRVEKDLELRGIPQRKLLAALVRLLEETSIRVGSEEYARANDSFGLTTLNHGHVHLAGAKVTFDFKGKSGVAHCVEVRNRRLAKIVRDCHEIPGQDLFQYVDEEGHPVKIRSEDVNAYIREIAGTEFSAKDFRTWNGTREAIKAFRLLGPADSPTAAKKNVVEAVKKVAAILGNRPATCRKYYIHPAVTEAYLSGVAMGKAIGARGGAISAGRFSEEEEDLLRVISSYMPAAPRCKAPLLTKN